MEEKTLVPRLENLYAKLREARKPVAPKRLYLSLILSLTDILDELIPLRKTTSSPKDCIKQKWWTSDIRALIHKRNKLWKKANSMKSRSEFEVCRKEVRARIKEAKENFWERENRNADIQNIYRLAKTLRRNKRTQIVVFEDRHLNTKEIPERLNKYFSNPLNLQIQEKHRNKERKNIIMRKNSKKLMYLPIASKEIDDAIEATNPNKAFGVDGISPRIFKPGSKTLKQILLVFFNMFWRTGIYPEDWNKAEIIPIPKSDKTKLSHNEFRPISLLNTFCKLFEKIIQARLTKISNNEKWIPENQTGFRRIHGVNTNLIHLHEKIVGATKNLNVCQVVFVDFTKAYDTVNRDILIGKLISRGLRGNLRHFMSSFLNKRSSRVKWGNNRSSWTDCLFGVPQGSCLSPLLFNIYTSELCSLPNIMAFADDFAIIETGPSYEKTTTALCETLGLLESMAAKLCLAVSINKTKYMKFGVGARSRKKPRVELTMAGNEIKQVDSWKYLGVVFDKNLRFSDHITAVHVKAKKRALLFRWLMHRIKGCKSTILLTIYKIYIRPILEFASPLLSELTLSSRRKLERIQQTFLCWVLGTAFWTARYQINLMCRILPIDKRIEARAITIFFKRKTAGISDSRNIWYRRTSNALCDRNNIDQNGTLQKKEIEKIFYEDFLRKVKTNEDKCEEESLTRLTLLNYLGKGVKKTKLSRQNEVTLNQLRLDTLPFVVSKTRGAVKRRKNCAKPCKCQRVSSGHFLFECKLLKRTRRYVFGKAKIRLRKRKLEILTDDKYDEKMLCMVTAIRRKLSGMEIR